ncbi:MAG: endolytic transglycosylase MltG [Candidatus Yanofskybacteria bacterium]|nr:endolytic transglycosylase MltG [Candidatus Yanofskybacteria bacterium]MBI4120218.1 endolytic transglycosylase MltG [Parcubacteria group bacterium]
MKDLSKTVKTHKIHLAALIAAGVFIGWFGFIILRSPLEASTEVIIIEGQDVSAIAETLKKEGIIGNEFVFIVYAIVTGNEKKLQAGRYVFSPGATIPVIVNSMAEGFAESDDIVITIPEGFNVFDIDKRLASAGLIEEGEFASKYYIDEGQFFPDTYRIENQKFPKPLSAAGIPAEGLGTKISAKGGSASGGKNQNDPKIANELAEKMKTNFKNKTAGMFENLNIQKREEVVIIASILEKEARKEEDMHLVAGVIENRLLRGMMLQIDATVSYGACLRNFQFSIFNFQTVKHCDVSQVPVGAEIKIDGPYNTYMRAGLPPGPIANPGITAIQAVLNPAKSDFLYYLSTRDGSRVIFSKTVAEHAANRRKHLGL